MKISEFVRLTINEICDGVMNAVDEVDTKSKARGSENQVVASGDRRDNIDFEISVIVSENSTSNKEGGVGASLSVLNFGGKKGSQKEELQERSAKINFSVPVYFSYLTKPKN